MRIAVISGHFMPGIGYQEVYLARAFSRLGHEVQVFTSNKPSPSVRTLRTSDYVIGRERDEKYNYSIRRLPATVAVGSLVFSSELGKAVKGYAPDIAVVVAVGKLFPWSILNGRAKRSFRLLALFGDNSDFANMNGVRSNLLQHIIKDRIYRRAIRSCDKVFLYTPETESIILSRLPKRLTSLLREKQVLSTLGYDPDEFYFDQRERQVARKELGVAPDEVLLITSTRMTPTKELEHVVSGISSIHSEGWKVRYIMIGFLNDTYSEQLRTYLKRQPTPEIFHCYPFLDHDKVRQFYCASDLGIWTQAAISIQEAMGTGLPILVENKPSVNHLVQEGVNGWFHEKERLAEAIGKAVEEISVRDSESRNAHRRHLVKINSENLCYDNIASKMLESMLPYGNLQRPHARSEISEF